LKRRIPEQIVRAMITIKPT